ncbi:hypothetical protein QVD99_003812 [Batrachochytrium dendrobatidis]|nr:hypothetical protein QVD99_003812 [Batrachochytrium dendrobatidis]
MGTTFLKAIVICLLSRRVSLEESMKAVTLQESSQIKETPKKTIIKPKYFDTPDKPKRQSARLQGQPNPSFVSGYDDKGLPIYTLIRVVPQEVVAAIEDEIAIQEKKEYQKQTSEMTLSTVQFGYCLRKLTLLSWNVTLVSSKVKSSITELDTFDNSLVFSSPANSEDALFDTIVGEIETIIMDDKFIALQQAFLSKHCNVFDESDENKLEYTAIFQQYNQYIESYLCKRLKVRLPWFSMPDFLQMIKQRPDQAEGDVFDMLHSLGEFIEFKDLMIGYIREKEGRGPNLDCLLSVSSANRKQ